MNTWLWPNRTIGKNESGELREEHNAAVTINAELLEALEELVAERDNEDWAADTGGIVLARMAIRKAKGE